MKKALVTVATVLTIGASTIFPPIDALAASDPFLPMGSAQVALIDEGAGSMASDPFLPMQVTEPVPV